MQLTFINTTLPKNRLETRHRSKRSSHRQAPAGAGAGQGNSGTGTLCVSFFKYLRMGHGGASLKISLSQFLDLLNIIPYNLPQRTSAPPNQWFLLHVSFSFRIPGNPSRLVRVHIKIEFYNIHSTASRAAHHRLQHLLNQYFLGNIHLLEFQQLHLPKDWLVSHRSIMIS